MSLIFGGIEIRVERDLVEFGLVRIVVARDGRGLALSSMIRA